MKQPWLTDDLTGEDDFTRASPVIPARRVGLALAVAVAILAVGTARDLAIGVLDLPLFPGSDIVIAAAQALDEAARMVGADRPHAWLRGLREWLEALRF